MKCPGQDSRYWKPGAIFEAHCPKCGAMVEFFKDDSRRTCPGCGEKVMNPEMDFGCATYCPYAEQCLGGLPPELKEKKERALRERIVREALELMEEDAGTRARAQRFFILVDEIARKEGVSPGLCAATAVLLVTRAKGGENPKRGKVLLESAGVEPRVIQDADELAGRILSGDKSMGREGEVLRDADLLASEGGETGFTGPRLTGEPVTTGGRMVRLKT